MTPTQFQILRATRKVSEEFDAAIAQVGDALTLGAIRNVVLQDLKFTLSRIVDEAWAQYVSDPYFNAGKWKDQPEDVQALYDGIMIMGLHDVIGASKKVARTTASGPAVEAMRAYCAEVLPLSLAVASLKDKVVKGRAPNVVPSRPENPNKVVKTCPVCFRSIAVLRETMAHHGFKRPGHGWQTASCQGVRFKPLEVSADGLRWLITTLRRRLLSLEAAYGNRDKKDSLMVRKPGRKVEFETITKESSQWSRHFDLFVAELKSEIRGLKRELPMLDKKLADWAPEVGA